MISGFKDLNLHKKFIATNDSPITLIKFIERSIFNISSLSNSDLKDFDIDWILNLVRSIDPIYNTFDNYLDSVTDKEEGYIVVNIKDINRDSESNTLELYSLIGDDLKYSGSFFSSNNINIKKILNYKIIYAKDEQLNGKNWYNNYYYNEYETSLYNILNYIFGFIYVDLDNDSLVDSVDVVDSVGKVCFDFKEVWLLKWRIFG